MRRIRPLDNYSTVTDAASSTAFVGSIRWRPQEEGGNHLDSVGSQLISFQEASAAAAP
jgi:hypothetical protein